MERLEIDKKKNRGRLKIYFGYAPGVGKTFAMLQEGLRLRERGVDVVIGYIEGHTHPDTLKLLDGQETISTLEVDRGDSVFAEMDVDGIIKRAPQVVLIDELAHTNIHNSRNKKRYEDVLEILDKGINVITTLNVQHVDMFADKIEHMLLIKVKERVPDQFLCLANQIVNIDLSIEDLRERLKHGKVYAMDMVEMALIRFFTHENLSLLRKFALQGSAQNQLRKIELDRMFAEQAMREADEIVMCAISANTLDAEVIIRKSIRMANQLSSKCYVVYVHQKSEYIDKLNPDQQERLLKNFQLAEGLGAEVITLQDSDISEALIKFAETNKVKHIVFGKTLRSSLKDRLFGSVHFDFIYNSKGIDIHLVSTSLGPLQTNKKGGGKKISA